MNPLSWFMIHKLEKISIDNLEFDFTKLIMLYFNVFKNNWNTLNPISNPKSLQKFDKWIPRCLVSWYAHRCNKMKGRMLLKILWQLLELIFIFSPVGNDPGHCTHSTYLHQSISDNYQQSEGTNDGCQSTWWTLNRTSVHLCCATMACCVLRGVSVVFMKITIWMTHMTNLYRYSCYKVYLLLNYAYASHS